MTGKNPDLQYRVAIANAVGQAFEPNMATSEIIRRAVGKLRCCPVCGAQPPSWAWTEGQSPSAAVWASIVCRDCKFDVGPDMGTCVINVTLASRKRY